MSVSPGLIHLGYTIVRDCLWLLRKAAVPHADCPACQCLVSGPSGCEALERVLAETLRGSYNFGIITLLFCCAVCGALGYLLGSWARPTVVAPRTGASGRRLGVLKDGARESGAG